MAVHVGILPKDVLDTLVVGLEGEREERRGLRFLRLPHPRTGIPSLFLPYAQSSSKKVSILEVQTVAPTNERSWFMSEGQVISNGKMLVMTRVDPVFLLISLLQTITPTDGTAGNFLPLDDLIEAATEKVLQHPPCPANPEDPSTHLSKSDLTYFFDLSCTQQAVRRVCDVKNITPEITVYRYSAEKIVALLKAKVQRINTPVVFESNRTLVRALARDGLMEDGKEQLLEAGRLRAACDLVSQYLSSSLRQTLLASYDFADLNVYMESLQAEAAAIAAAEMDKAEARESKGATGKADVNKKRKGTKGSMGVEKLKKANTKGMAKLSTFFQPKS